MLGADNNVAGTWTITGDVQGYPVNETCTFTQDAGKLTGSCKGSEKTYDTTGTVEGQKVVFKHAGEYQGDALTITFTGKLDDAGALKGTIDVDPMGVSGDFTAKKG
jgi:hypothetical protein